jgi:hypothetical protein
MVDNLSPIAVRQGKTDGKTGAGNKTSEKRPRKKDTGKKTPLVWSHGAVWLQTSGAIQMP